MYPSWICKSCLKEIIFIEKIFCSRCGSPYRDKCLCSSLPDFIVNIRSLYLFNGAGKELIHRWKFNANYFFIKDLFENLILKKFPFKNIKFDALIYVPTYFIKKINRGFNQSEEIAKIIASRFNISLKKNCIGKKSFVKSQSKIKDYKTKAKNISNAFYMKEIIMGEKILIVDDVITSGSTIKELAKIIKSYNKQAKFYIFTLSMAI